LTLLVRLNDALGANILLSILLGFLAAVGLLQLSTYLNGEDLVMYTECQVGMVLVFALMIVVNVLNALNARAVARMVKTPEVLRALYFFILFPIIFLTIMLANAAEGFIAVLLFGAPLFIVGAILLPYFANVIYIAAGGHVRRATLMLICHRCGFMFLIYRDSSGSICPMCHVPNRNPLWSLPMYTGSTVPLGGDLTAATPPPGGWSEIKPAILDPDWQDDRLGMHPGTSLLGPIGRMLRIMGLVLLAIAATVSLGIGMLLVNEWWGWEYGWETTMGLSMVLLGIAGICGAVMRAKGYWLWVALASSVLLCIEGAWFSYEWEPFIGIMITVMGVWAIVTLIAAAIQSRGASPRGHMLYLGPPLREGPQAPVERQLGRKGW